MRFCSHKEAIQERIWFTSHIKTSTGLRSSPRSQPASRAQPFVQAAGMGPWLLTVLAVRCSYLALGHTLPSPSCSHTEEAPLEEASTSTAHPPSPALFPGPQGPTLRPLPTPGTGGSQAIHSKGLQGWGLPAPLVRGPAESRHLPGATHFPGAEEMAWAFT